MHWGFESGMNRLQTEIESGDVGWAGEAKLGTETRGLVNSGWIMSPASSTFNLAKGIIADSVLTEGWPKLV